MGPKEYVTVACPDSTFHANFVKLKDAMTERDAKFKPKKGGS
jgi:hypothetical protein